MDVGTAIDMLQRRLGGQFSRSHLREELRIAVNELYSLPGLGLGRLPAPVPLSTEDGVLHYSLPYRIVTRVFELYSSSPGRTGYSGYSRNYLQSGDSVAEVIDLAFGCKESFDPYVNTCELYFFPPYNPGTSTDKIWMEVEAYPEQIVSDNQIVPLPEHIVTSLVYYLIKKRVEESAYGVDIYSSPEIASMLARLKATRRNTYPYNNLPGTG